jgi:hypothetical protein
MRRVGVILDALHAKGFVNGLSNLGSSLDDLIPLARRH